MPELRDCPVLERNLTELGCPYPQGSVDAVAWLHGYRAGMLRAFKELCVALDRPVPQWALVRPERLQ